MQTQFDSVRVPWFQRVVFFGALRNFSEYDAGGFRVVLGGFAMWCSFGTLLSFIWCADGSGTSASAASSQAKSAWT